ncbi:MAG: hypothetical protein EXQ48_08750 [Acidobacteria bacterium]|nr:hypothetical protein [Acidobacteriota bacterium]
MSRRGISIAAVSVALVALGFAATWEEPVHGQRTTSSAASLTAVPGQKGGQDFFGGYEAVADWPKSLSTLPGHEKWTWGAGQSVYAESENRVFYLQRGELPVIGRLQTTTIAPSIDFPIRRAPMRNASSASPPGALFAKDGKSPGDDSDSGVNGVDFNWHHTIVVVDRQGNFTEDWTRWDKMLRRPHFITINPYDPEKHIWLIDDYRHALFKFTNDGQRVVQTIGVPNEPGTDNAHFYRPTFVAFLPDAMFVSDGYVNSRVMKFDKDGKFLLTWGQEGKAPDKRPGYFNNVHGLAVDPQTRRVFVLDRQGGRVQVFDDNGKYLDEWSFGGPPSDIHTFMIDSNRFLWAADQGSSKMLKYDLEGHFLYQFGTAGTEAPGLFWGTHGVSVDPQGNFYTAEVFRGGFQKYRPRPGANPATLLGKAVNPGWKN